MEVEFPSSDDDSIYYSESEVVLERPPLSPVAITLTGPSAKELDEAMAIIEADEMTSDEEDLSDASTQPLTDSLDPISDDDMIDVSRKPHFPDHVSDDSPGSKPDPTNVVVHTSLITPSSSDDPPTDALPSTTSAPVRDESDEDNMVSVPGLRHAMDTAMEDMRDTNDLIVSPETTPSKMSADTERPVPVSIDADHNFATTKSTTFQSDTKPATEITDLKSTDQAASPSNMGMRDVEQHSSQDSPEAVNFAEKADLNATREESKKADTEGDFSGLKPRASTIVVFDANEPKKVENNLSPVAEESKEAKVEDSNPPPQPSSFAARLAAFGSSIVKKSVEQRPIVKEPESKKPDEEMELKAGVSDAKEESVKVAAVSENKVDAETKAQVKKSEDNAPMEKDGEVPLPDEPRLVARKISSDEAKGNESSVDIPPQPPLDSGEKVKTGNAENSGELPSKGMIDKLVSEANLTFDTDKPSSPSSDELDDMFFDAQSVPEPSKRKNSAATKSTAGNELSASTADGSSFNSPREMLSKEDPKSPDVSHEEARQIELAQASLDVPDVEDIKESKEGSIPKKKLSAKQSLDESDLEDLEVSELGRRRSLRAGDSTSPAPDFPVMDEIDINRSAEKSGEQFIPHQPEKKIEATKHEMDEDDQMFGADEFVEEESVGNISLAARNATAITKTALTTPLKDIKSAKKPAASKSMGSGGFGLFSMSSFYRAFKKPSKGKDSESEAGPSSERDMDVGKSSEIEPASEKKKKRSKKEIQREKGRTQSTTSDSVVSVRGSAAVTEGDAYLEWRTPEEMAEEERHLRLEETLKSQIATLRSARSGFVDLALLTPMTEKTLAAVDLEAKRILSQLPDVEKRKEVLARQVEILEITTEAELSAKEKTLVAAKIKVAEAKCELVKLRHDLFVMKRDIAKPGKAAAQERLRLSIRREKAEKDLRAATESKETMERNLEQRKAMLKTYRNEVSRLTKSVQDLEGEWA